MGVFRHRTAIVAIVAIVICAASATLEATFGFRKPLTIDNTRVAGTADFWSIPILVSLQADSDLQANVTSPTGCDIQFRADDGVRIFDHEIESYDPATGTLVAWVNVRQLRPNVDTVIYIYYGDSGVSCSLENAQGVWDPNYVGVWHLAEDPAGAAPQMLDSTSFVNHGTSVGVMTTTDQVSGKIGGALDFDGLDDLVDTGSDPELDDLGPLTVAAWIRPRSAGGSGAGNIVAKYGASSTGRWFLEIDNTVPEVDAFEFNKNFSSGSAKRVSNNSLVAYNTWQYMVATWDGSEVGTNIRIFKDGVEVLYQSSTNGTLPIDSDAPHPSIIGNRSTGINATDGLIDEVRLSKSIRSDDWIRTHYNNQNNPTKNAGCSDTGFACVGVQEALSGAFIDMSAASGLNTGGAKDGGLAWGDFNDDGCLDVAVNTEDAVLGSRLYMQDNSGSCDGTFTDVTACLAPGLAASVRERSVIWGDLENDGDLDLIRNTSSPDIEIYLNNGSTPVSGCGVAWSVFGIAGAPSQILDATSLPFQFNSEGLGLMDYDADGDLDLMSDQDGGIAIFDNTGGVLTYVATPVLPATQAGKSDYASVTDIDVDGDVDILSRRGGTPDLYLNDANTGAFLAGTFDEAPANGDKGGVAFCDFDDDGDFDLFWTQAGADLSDPNQVWEQTGVGSATFVARGVPAGILGVIDGVACGDVDNDGDLDVMLTSDGNDQLFRNDGGFTFTDISPASFGVNDGEATAFGDYDRDGDVDLLINQATANELWQNQTNNNNYLVVRALRDDVGADRDAIGATIRLLDCGLAPVSGVREVNGGRGHGSQDPAYVHVGLPSCGSPNGPNSRYVVEVRFLDGKVVQKAVVPSWINGYQLVVVRNTDTDDLTACTTAVELVSFEAKGADSAVVLEWETGSELQNLGFHLHRGISEAGPFERITSSLIPGLGSSPEGARYSFVDSGLQNEVGYFYKLEDIESTGQTKFHGPVSALPQAGLSVEDVTDAPPHIRTDEEYETALDARITYGDPSANELRIRKRGRRHVDVELVTRGFYAIPLQDGSVRLEIPGFDASAEEFPLPVKRTWVRALTAKKVELVSVKPSGILAFTGLRPTAFDEGELYMNASGSVRFRRRARHGARAFKEEGLSPPEAARILSVAFQEQLKKALLELAPLRWDGRNERLLLARKLRVRLRFHGVEATEDIRGRRHRADDRHRSRRVTARLATVERGLYGVRFEDVFGDRRRGVRSSRVRLSRQGEPVAFHVAPAPNRFGPGSTLYFFGEGERANPYGHEAVYELELGAPGMRMEIGTARPEGQAAPFYWQRIEAEEKRLYMTALVTAEDPWFWELVFGGTRKSFPLQLSAVAEGVAPARLSLSLQGASDLPVSPDHHVRVWMNGVRVGEDSWNAKQPRQLDVEIPAGVLRRGENVLDVENVGDTEAAYSLVAVDRFALDYPRVPETADGYLEGRFDHTGQASVSGLSPKSFVLDVTEEHPRWLRGASHTEEGALAFRVEAGRSYLAVSSETVLRASVRKSPASTLKRDTNQADYIVIGPKEFLSAAEPLLSHRESQGLTVQAVGLSEIYSEFGFGESTPEAIRSFLSHAYHHWSAPLPRYVLLLGDANYDFKNYLGTGAEHRRLPPLMVKTRFMWTVSDPTYAAVNGEDLLADLAIGRLPAASVEELATMVAKILAYERGRAGGPGGRVVLVADDPDPAGNFEADAEALSTTVLGTRDVEKLYLRHLGAQETRARILESFDEGASIVSYLGHGGIDLWADEQLLSSSSIPSLSAQREQPLVITMNCLNGYFHFPFFDSLGEALLKAEDRGAIAAFSPSGFSLHGPAHRFHEALLRELLSGSHPRLGDAVLAAQRAFADTGALPELLSIYHLLGDPALAFPH